MRARDAAGNAFQTWHALLAILLRLKLDKLLQISRSEEERNWLANKAVPRVLTSRMKFSPQMLKEVGYRNISAWTSIALDLHDYQYNGPDPDMAVSKYRSREEAAIDIKLLINELVKRIEELKPRVKWSDELERALAELKGALQIK